MAITTQISGILPTAFANTRAFAYRRFPQGKGLESLRRARNLRVVRVRRVFQSFPAKHRYPLTCGRLCASPSHPPAPFSTQPIPYRSTRPDPTAGLCRRSASQRCQFASARVTRDQMPATVNLTKLLTKGAKNESRTTVSFHHGRGVHHRRLVGLQPRGHDVAVRLFDGRASTALDRLTLTACNRFPARVAPRGPFPLRPTSKKESACSRRS